MVKRKKICPDPSGPMITRFNLFARKRREHGGLPGRFFDVLTDLCWVRTLGFWSFDLRRPDPPWSKFRDDSIRWTFASTEDCRRWERTGSDGFSPDDCDLLVRLIEHGDRVLVGRIAGIERENEASEDVPDCYAVRATGRKPMTERCCFRTEPGEAVIRTVYTRNVFRGRGLATRLYAEHCRLAAEDGLTALLVDIESSNTASIRAAEKAGAVRVAGTTFYWIRLLKHSFYFMTGGLRSRIEKS